jgi:hypothetical protein
LAFRITMDRRLTMDRHGHGIGEGQRLIGDGPSIDLSQRHYLYIELPWYGVV